ncbi:hypothetical protein [Parasphingorhabdus halotolerans]|uniref:Uncharacterized protein n=1 Tax=Parasphingorhabdus halotolerans TaxID=2725558 RepID=A0A6H2DQD1_9SPHN|nr:hypothetical protein [Parasphingorhabdus halotolerans]QJB69876.1 hypothetical protein HF685_11785 [Parasphingorhabdus halotolerans]
MIQRRQSKQRLLQHGGSRRQRDVASNQLTEKQCRDLIGAAMVAWESGCPFNRFITLLWERSGVDARRNGETTARFVKLASDWARRHGDRLVWAWVQEHGWKNGADVHLILHVPPELDPIFKAMPAKWTKLCLPGAYVRKTLQCQKIRFGDIAVNNPEAYETAIMGKVHYMLKCAPAALERELGLVGRGHKPWGQSCTTFRKQAGIWQGWNRNSQRD